MNLPLIACCFFLGFAFSQALPYIRMLMNVLSILLIGSLLFEGVHTELIPDMFWILERITGGDWKIKPVGDKRRIFGPKGWVPWLLRIL